MNKPLKITLISLGSAVALALILLLCARFEVLHKLHACWYRTFSKPDDYVRTEVLPARRGDILDRDGDVLVRDRERHDIYMDCCVVEDRDKWLSESLALAEGLAELLPSCSADEWYDRFQQARAAGNRYIPVVKDASEPLRDALRALPLFREGRFQGGFIDEVSRVREHPYGDLAFRTIGFVRTEGNRFYNVPVGLEGKYGVVLAGQDGQLTVKHGVRRGQKRLREIGRIEPVPGSDIRTTLDMRLQAVSDSILRAVLDVEEDLDRATLVLMEVETGAIRVMANLMRNGDRTSVGEYFNNAIARRIEPGEVLQTMTQAKLLDGEDSTNVSAESLRSYCLPDELAFDLEGLRSADIHNSSLLLTPIDILSFYNTIATRGKMVQPYLVQSISSGGKDVQLNGVKYLSEDVLSYRICDTLTCALRENVLSGTATRLRDARYPVAGMTGTSRQQWNTQDGSDEEVSGYTDKQGNSITAATFVGFFPADKPIYSVVCVLESRPCHKPFADGILPAQAVKELINEIEAL